MRILSVEHKVPDTKLSNEESTDRMVQASRQYLSETELQKACSHLNAMFKAAGAESRYITDGKQQPLDLVINAAQKALAKAGVSPGDLDFILFGGVTRRYLVPSSASVIQNALGARKATCFDTIDACASWARALQVANMMSREYPSGLGLIVTNETGYYENCDTWTIKSTERLDWKCSALTLGEAATATVVSTENPDNFRFASKTYGEHGDLAVLPIVDTEKYEEIDLRNHERLKFQTNSGELTKHGLKKGIVFFRKADFFKDGGTDFFVVHAGAEASIMTFLRITNFPIGELVMTFRQYGNTVASSIPLGLSLATADGRIQQGHRILLATAAAGISIVGTIFEF